MRQSRRALTFAYAAIACALLLGSVRAWAQARSDAVSVQAVRQAIFEAEDRRAPTGADLQTLLDGTRHPSEAVQRMAIRALGRLERPALVGNIQPALSSRFAPVRAAAAEALGQAVASGSAGASGAVQAALLKHLGGERDGAVIGAICWTLGRLPYATAQAARSAEVTLLVAALPIDASSTAPLALQLGVARGLESLLRRNAKLFTPSPETVRRLKQMALERRKPRRYDDAEDTIRVRRLAMAALVSSKQADEATITAAAADPDGQVRRLAVMAMAATAAGSIPEAARARFVSAGLADPDYLVRYEALRVHGRTLTAGAADWGPVMGALSDRSPHVALLAIDLLGNPKAHPDSAVEKLRTVTGALPAPQEARAEPAGQGDAKAVAEWHQPARALVSLAGIAPDEARAFLPGFAASAWWPVRMYAARAATILRDSEWLLRLARDERDNVREAAIGGLMSVRGHEADGHYLEALERADYQLVMTAARALEGTPRRTEAMAALIASLSRITGEKRETSRDVRLALLARIGELGQPADAPALLPYTGDFDGRVAAEAAEAIGRWTGQTPRVTTHPLPIAVPVLADVERLRGARAVIRIAGRGAFDITLLPDEAPATVARFVALVRSGYYNGLTIHRIVPAFIVQGGSPAANEFVGDGPFLRDEIGLEPHVRGAASISTRGRDTGDAQIWFNLVDNPRLDHDYSVFGRVTAGAEVLDRILECDVIEGVEIVDSGRGR